MLKIKLKRTGRKKLPFYKIVIMPALSKGTGKTIHELGYYNPLTKVIKINKIDLYEFIKNGVYPTNTVRHLLYKLLKL